MFEGTLAVALVFAACTAAAIFAARVTPVDSLGDILGFSVLFLTASGLAWWGALFFNVVHVDSIARSFGVSDVVPWFPTILVVPPLIGSILFAFAAGRKLARRLSSSSRQIP